MTPKTWAEKAVDAILACPTLTEAVALLTNVVLLLADRVTVLEAEEAARQQFLKAAHMQMMDEYARRNDHPLKGFRHDR